MPPPPNLPKPKTGLGIPEPFELMPGARHHNPESSCDAARSPHLSASVCRQPRTRPRRHRPAAGPRNLRAAALRSLPHARVHRPTRQDLPPTSRPGAACAALSARHRHSTLPHSVLALLCTPCQTLHRTRLRLSVTGSDPGLLSHAQSHRAPCARFGAFCSPGG